MDKKMRRAVIICVLVVLFSTYLSAGVGVRRLSARAEDAFIKGTDGSGYSIYTDLQSRAALSRNLCTVAARYLGADDKAVKAVEDAADKLEGEENPKKAYKANAALEKAVAALDGALSDSALSDTDESYRVGILTDLDSYAYTIAHDGYNDFVRSGGGFDLGARIFRLITLAKPIEYFE